MSQKVAIRTGGDRLRYAICLEITLMLFLVPAGALFFDKGILDIGLLGVALSAKAVLVGLVYNWIFDRLDAYAGRVSSNRSMIGRILHAAGFEITLTVTSLPIYVWWLDIGVLQALMADVIVTTFVVAHTFLFTLAYDRMFPVVGGPLPSHA